MAETHRFDQANRTFESVFQLLDAAYDNSGWKQTLGRISDLMIAADFVGISPYDENLETENAHIFVTSYRPDQGLLPTSTFVFQATPHDSGQFPTVISGKTNLFAEVVSRSTASLMWADAIPSIEDPADRRPIVTLAYFDNTLTQAIVGVDAFTKLVAHTDVEKPLNLPPRHDPELPLYVGEQHVASATVVKDVLGKSDSTGLVDEWLDYRVSSFVDQAHGDLAWREFNPPAGTELAEAYAEDPYTNNIINLQIAALGVLRYALDYGHEYEEALRFVGRHMLKI